MTAVPSMDSHDENCSAGRDRRRGFSAHERSLLLVLERQLLEPGADGFQRVIPKERQAVSVVQTLAQFDNAITAPRNVWRDAAEYYTLWLPLESP